MRDSWSVSFTKRWTGYPRPAAGWSLCYTTALDWCFHHFPVGCVVLLFYWKISGKVILVLTALFQWYGSSRPHYSLPPQGHILPFSILYIFLQLYWNDLLSLFHFPTFKILSNKLEYWEPVFKPLLLEFSVLKGLWTLGLRWPCVEAQLYHLLLWTSFIMMYKMKITTLGSRR